MIVPHSDMFVSGNNVIVFSRSASTCTTAFFVKAHIPPCYLPRIDLTLAICGSNPILLIRDAGNYREIPDRDRTDFSFKI